jgi:hypothetical protein
MLMGTGAGNSYSSSSLQQQQRQTVADAGGFTGGLSSGLVRETSMQTTASSETASNWSTASSASTNTDVSTWTLCIVLYCNVSKPVAVPCRILYAEALQC